MSLYAFLCVLMSLFATDWTIQLYWIERRMNEWLTDWLIEIEWNIVNYACGAAVNGCNIALLRTRNNFVFYIRPFEFMVFWPVCMYVCWPVPLSPPPPLSLSSSSSWPPVAHGPWPARTPVCPDWPPLIELRTFVDHNHHHNHYYHNLDQHRSSSLLRPITRILLLDHKCDL